MNVKVIKYQFHRLYRRLIQVVGSQWYVDRDLNPRKCILLAGVARRETTWLVDLITWSCLVIWRYSFAAVSFWMNRREKRHSNHGFNDRMRSYQ